MTTRIFRRSSSTLLDDRDDLEALIDVSAGKGGKDVLGPTPSRDNRSDTRSPPLLVTSNDDHEDDTSAARDHPEPSIFRPCSYHNPTKEGLWTLKRANPIVVSEDEDEDYGVSVAKRARTTGYEDKEAHAQDSDTTTAGFVLDSMLQLHLWARQDDGTKASLDEYSSCYENVCTGMVLTGEASEQEGLFASCSFGSDFGTDASSLRRNSSMVSLRRSSSTLSAIQAI